MKTIATLSLTFVLTTLTTAALAEEPTQPASPSRTSAQSDSKAYCDYVQGIAKSESILLQTPSAFGTVGVVSGSDATGGSSGLPPRGRIMAGMSYSLGGLFRGMAMDDAAEAECKRYRAESALHTFVAGNVGGQSKSALSAKLHVLSTGLPHAEAMVKKFEAGVAEGKNTVDDLRVIQMRTDALRAELHRTRAELGALSGVVDAPKESLGELVRNRNAAEKEASRQEAKVRSAKGWDLAVRGGYEQILGVQQTVPLFATATLSVNLGWFFQPGSEKSSVEGRQVWAKQQIEGVNQRAEAATQRLTALRTSERARLTETEALVSDLRTRQQNMETMSGERAQAYAQVLWFDRLNIEAEHAYLQSHVRELDQILRADQGAVQ